MLIYNSHFSDLQNHEIFENRIPENDTLSVAL